MSKKISLDDIDNLSEELDDDVLIDDDEILDDDLIGDEITASQNEAVDEIKNNYTVTLPTSKQVVRYEPINLDPEKCIAHPLNQRALSDHNRITLKSRIASFKRIGQQEPVLAIVIDGVPNIIDGYGRVKTWLFCREDEPGQFKGNVLKANVIEASSVLTNKDIIELSKTANESELLSDWNKAVMYQSMLDMGIYPELKALCEQEGLNYEVWKKTIKLAALPRRYIELFVKTEHIPKTFIRKVSSWEKLLASDKKASKAFFKKLEELTNVVQSFVNGKIDTAPYNLDKTTGVNELIKQLEALLPKPAASKKVAKEKDFKFASSDVAFIGRKARNNTYAIKFDKCSDETFSQILASIKELTGAKELD